MSPHSTPSPRAAIVVQHHPEQSRFEARVDGQLCVCVYRPAGPGVVAFVHTEVPPALEGRGIAAALVRTALEWARDEGLQVRPLCSYVALYLRRHPEFSGLLGA